MIAIVDYGVGNLFSLESSFKAIGQQAVVTGDPAVLVKADGIILPGVGAFRDASEKLRATGLDSVLKDLCAAGKPLMGICLGMQMLFEKSLEYGEYEGLGLIPGTVRPLRDVIDPALKIPHIGWNALQFVRSSPLFSHIQNGDHVYFVHSYWADTPDENRVANTEYSCPITAAVQRGNVMGCQFHPEKSGDTGLKILTAFCEICGKGENA